MEQEGYFKEVCQKWYWVPLTGGRRLFMDQNFEEYQDAELVPKMHPKRMKCGGDQPFHLCQ